ncbi:hypothetical protein AMTRI_Chr05g61460 [Amborella trichopoda]
MSKESAGNSVATSLAQAVGSCLVLSLTRTLYMMNGRILHTKLTKQLQIQSLEFQIPTKMPKKFAWLCNVFHVFATNFLPRFLEQHHKILYDGLGIGVSSMRAGERALLYVGWELGYGKEGNFSFPNVPPMADFLYEVELIGVHQFKVGNGHFKEERLEEAMQQYEIAIAYIGDDFMFQLFGKYKDMALAVRNPCHPNMAACLLKLERYEDPIGRGKAIAALGRTDDAREDFQKAKKLAPEDKAVAKELRLLAEQDR